MPLTLLEEEKALAWRNRQGVRDSVVNAQAVPQVMLTQGLLCCRDGDAVDQTSSGLRDSGTWLLARLCPRPSARGSLMPVGFCRILRDCAGPG